MNPDVHTTSLLIAGGPPPRALLTDIAFAPGEPPSAADFGLSGPLAMLLESEAGCAHVQHRPSLRGLAGRMASVDRCGPRIADLCNLERRV